MRVYVNGHQAVTEEDFAELAGTPLDLWFGEPNESPEQRAAREDAARDILAEDPEMPYRLGRLVAEAIEERTSEVAKVVALPRPVVRARSRKGAAA